MPYDIRKTAEGYDVFNQQTGESKGISKTRAKAEAHMKALYANEPKGVKSTPGLRIGGMILDDTYTPRPITEVYVDGKRRTVDRNTAAQPGPKAPAEKGGLPRGIADEGNDDSEVAGLTSQNADAPAGGKAKPASAVNATSGKSEKLPPQMKRGGKVKQTSKGVVAQPAQPDQMAPRMAMQNQPQLPQEMPGYELGGSLIERLRARRAKGVPAEKKGAKNFIKAAVGNNKGKFRAKAQAAGKTTAEYAEEEAGAPGKLGAEARLAKTLMGLRKK